MTAKQRDMTGAKEAGKVSRWIEPWGDARFPIDVDAMAKNCHDTYGWDDPITKIHAAPWKDIDGFLQRNPENPKEWWITYTTNATPERQLFTKAHELGHYILHRKVQDQFRCGRKAIIEKDTGEPNIEAQANQFASYLLMPATDVRSRIEKAPITLDTISQLAGFYGVSFEAMCIRIIELANERAVLIYWDNGMMKRWSRSELAKKQRLWIDEPNGGPLEPINGTVAADTSIRQCPDGKIVPANLWFKNAPEGEMLREMKHTSDKYERVLSLLIVPKFESRWARDWDDHTFDTYDRFIEAGQLPVR
ncbi:MAG: ImmA/IrrE family metallo-endopeptidase [Betaproteobacteria bacterium]|nr:ImmA/IrrE family metallo-endopeptidase [Betaproteobacteria bacterium]